MLLQPMEWTNECADNIQNLLIKITIINHHINLLIKICFTLKLPYYLTTNENTLIGCFLSLYNFSFLNLMLRVLNESTVQTSPNSKQEKKARKSGLDIKKGIVSMKTVSLRLLTLQTLRATIFDSSLQLYHCGVN